MTSPQNDIPFVEYNSWPNKPTWFLPQALGDSEVLYDEARQKANDLTVEQWKKWLMTLVKIWQEGKVIRQSTRAAITQLVQGYLMDSIDYLDYLSIRDALTSGDPTIKKVKNFHSLKLTQLVLTLFAGMNWQELLEQSSEPYDVTFHGWLRDRCMEWVQSKEVRKHQGAIHTYVTTVLDLYFDAVEWEHVVQAIKES